MDREVHNNGIHVRHIAPDRWWQRAKWELLREYTSWNGMVIAPIGFVTDGASIPWFLWWRFSPTGRHFGAAIVHDYVLISTGDWKQANHQFDEELRALNVDSFDRRVMVTAVGIWSRVRSIFKRDPSKI
jgi:hypothetical protein